MIQVDKLVKRFGSVRALDEVSFTVESGEVVGLLGPNGAGKTTTMRILTGAMAPTSGKLRVAGLDAAKTPLEIKRRVGYLPEVPPLYPEMRVRAYLGFVAELRALPKPSRRQRVDSALERCWLEDRAGQPIGQLSKGYRQRVGLAQAILHEPELLILDEPTSGLDPRQIIEVRQLIRELAGQHTVILSSHILSEVAATCERVIVMNAGQVVATDTPEGLTRLIAGADRVELIVRGPEEQIAARLSELQGVEEVERLLTTGEDVPRFAVVAAEGIDIRSQLATTVVAAGWELLGLHRKEPNLEEIFLRLTEEQPGKRGKRSTESPESLEAA